ncbi:MAG: ABC transporter substrate-binding protein [Trueperaceae bacterium]|nr:ABC transporter substrate-binding protein [Trueperaceae bacterium]
MKLLLLSVWLGVAAAPAWAQAPTITVAAELGGVFDALAAAYPGEAPQRSAGEADLVLAPGRASWDEVRTVVPVPDVTLRARTDDAEAAAFLRFARSPDAQAALIEGGFLPAEVSVSDQAGRTVRVPQPVRRIASPYGLSTYLVYAVGAGDRLVTAGYLGARDPQGAAAMERIDPDFPEVSAAAPADTTNVEFLATLAPDLVASSARAEWIPSAQALGMPVLAFDGESPDALADAMRMTGRALGPDAAARADAWVRYYRDVLARVARATEQGRAAPRVLFTGTDPSRVASGQMYQTDLIQAAGGVSVTAGLRGHWAEVGLEQVLAWNPELILVPPYGGASVAAITNDPSWQLLPAVREGRVLRVPKLVAPWDTPVPDSVLAVVWLAEVLHPDATDLSCAEEARFFYRRFYDYALTSDEVTSLCRR